MQNSSVLIVIGVVLIVGICVFVYAKSRVSMARSAALLATLKAVSDKQPIDPSMVASTIATGFSEVRENAKLWSGVYWGMTFAAAALSSIAALVLKLESIPEG